jgi:uncharacterized protein YhbP (UPF0306 family)
VLVVSLKRSNRPLSQSRIAGLLRSLLDASSLCAIATVTRSGNAFINTAYFGWAPDYRIVWLSSPAATHSRNLRGQGTAAIAVFDSHQVWGRPDRGVQLFGFAKSVEGADVQEAEHAYRQRFPGVGPSDLIPYRFYALRPRRVKLFDEAELGPGVFVTASVRAGGKIAWERTEIYEGRES